MKKVIANSIKEKRIEAKLSQSKLGKSIGVSHTAISYWENGINIPNVLDCWKLANTLKTTIDELVGRDINPNLIDKNKK